ncbi:uncharacterized protein METZ01_LOCUS315237 [marine metagenome]|uniref:Uncharacterized protein n=1 Tax=marine metagenome TaxID=408172 RepID=A0A382NMF8_9ZZZZ
MVMAVTFDGNIYYHSILSLRGHFDLARILFNSKCNA